MSKKPLNFSNETADVIGQVKDDKFLNGGIPMGQMNIYGTGHASMSLTAVCRTAHQTALDSIVSRQPSTQEKVLFKDKKMLTAEEAINILSRNINLGNGPNMVFMSSVFDKLTQEDREKVSTYFNNDLEFNKSLPEKFYAQLVSPQRIAEQNNPDHKAVNDFNAQVLMGKRPITPLNSEGKSFLMDSFSAYKPEPTNVSEKLSSLPGYVHSDEQLMEDIKEGNVILTMGPLMSSFIAVTPEGELIPNEIGDLKQNKPLFNKATHQQKAVDYSAVKKIKNASMSGACRNNSDEAQEILENSKGN